MFTAPSPRRARSNVRQSALLAVLLLISLGSLAPAASATPSTLTTLSDGSSNATLHFASCGSDASIGSLALPYDAVVESLGFNLTTTGNHSNQTGTFALFVGGAEEAVANHSVGEGARWEVAGDAINHYLREANASSGDVLVPLAAVGCSEQSDWWVVFGSIEVIYRVPTDVTLDVTSPSADVTYTNGSNFTVQGTVDPTDCTVTVNGVSVDIHVSNGTATFVRVIALEVGENAVRVVACANYGSEAVVERTVVRSDGTPNLTVDWPPPEFVTNETSVVVRGQTDPNATVTVNGVNVSVNATGAFEVEVALNASAGENLIEVVAGDGQGHNRTVTRVVVVDTQPPVIDLDLGADLAEAIEAGANITWDEVTIAGATDTLHAQVTVDGHNATVEGLHFAARIALDQGMNTVVIAATDPAGNRAETTLTIWVDSVAPTIDLDLAANVTAAIENGSAIHQRTLEVRGTTDSADTVVVVNEHEANQFGLNFSRVVELSDGWNTIVIVAEDHAGNRAEVRLDVLVDLSNPGLAVTLDDTAREALAHERPTRNASVGARVESNASTVRFTLNGQLMSAWNGSMNLSITLTEGNNTLLFEAVEGELVSSEEFRLVLDTSAPSLNASLNGTTEDNGTYTAHSRLLTVLGSTEPGASVHLCEGGAGANATAWCRGVDVADNGTFHGLVELDAHAPTLVTVTATDRAGNSANLSFLVVYEAPGFTNDTVVSVYIGGTHEGAIVAGSELVLEVGSEVAIPEGANVSWYIDGEYVGSGARLAEVVLDEGNHTIEVVVSTDTAEASASREVYVEPEAVLAPTSNSNWLALAVALALGAVGAAVAVTDRWRYFLLAAVAGSVFTRLQKPAPLDHFVRGRLYQLVCDEPGVHYAELKRRARLSNSSAAHHLRVLQKAGILRTVQDGTRTRFYPTDQPIDRETYGLSDSDRAVLETVTQAPGITETELSHKVGRSLSTVNRSVERMVALGYVTTAREGRTVSVFPRAGHEVPEAIGAARLPEE